MSDITITSLNVSQLVLCDILWKLNSLEEYEAFIAALPEPYKQEAVTMGQLILLEHIDQVTSTDKAEQMLRKIWNR